MVRRRWMRDSLPFRGSPYVRLVGPWELAPPFYRMSYLMRIRSLVLAVTAAALCLSLPHASAEVLKYHFDLDGMFEVPPVPTTGTGTALVTIDTDLSSMRVEAEFSGLV